jgi:hypothetical protein
MVFSGSIAVAAPAVAASRGVALRHVAEQLGYTYTYLGPQDAVTLVRPGVTVLLRPGEATFDVNDRTETTTQAPSFYRDDLYVSTDLANQLAQIASRYPRTQRIVVGVSSQAVTIAQTEAHGSISLDVRQAPGSEAIAVSGQAPSSVPVMLTVFGTVSSDIPDIVIGRHEVASDVNGRFSAIVPVAPDYFRGSILTLVATSLPGVQKASAQIVVGPPNGSVSVPAEQVPRGIR